MSKLVIPKIIAHRGAKTYAPENTLAAIRAAADLGVEWVELDVKLTKDGQAIIFHDESLDRCTNATGLVADVDLDTIRELDAGSWFGESFMNERIPTLEEAVELILDLKMGLNLEIKPCPGREVETAEVALDILTRSWDDETPPPLISSFSHVSLETAQDMITDYPRGLLIDDYIDNWQELAEYLQISAFNINARNLVRDVAEEYIDTQKPVIAYTVNDAEHARELLRWGIDSLITDVPDTLREAIETSH